VFWYVIIVVPLQTAIAIMLAVLLNTPTRAQQFFRTVFYAPSVTSAVVISAIFLWLYLRTGYFNIFCPKLRAVGRGVAIHRVAQRPTWAIQMIAVRWELKFPRSSGTSGAEHHMDGGDVPEHLYHRANVHDYVSGGAARHLTRSVSSLLD
jgi:hypothetical protein